MKHLHVYKNYPVILGKHFSNLFADLQAENEVEQNTQHLPRTFHACELPNSSHQYGTVRKE